MKKYFLTFILAITCISVAHSQIKVFSAQYKTFDGRTEDVYAIESKYCLIQISKNEISDSQVKDFSTLGDIVNRIDTLYYSYKSLLDFEPLGGNIEFQNKTNVFFGKPSCGAGCGLIGYKGIEISSFSKIYNKFKYKIHNDVSDHIIAYEFGRNFFTLSNKILFPYQPGTSDRNGGFAEGFANLLYTYIYDKILQSESERLFNDDILYLSLSTEVYNEYVNNLAANPYNVLSKWNGSVGEIDYNRRSLETPYIAFGILNGTFNIFGKEKFFPNFFKELRNLPDAKNIEDALDNIAFSASKAINTNLSAYFENALKFPLSKSTKEKIELLPFKESKLIKYEPTLWFSSPYHKIILNLRSTNYLKDDYTYRITAIDNKIVSETKSGNNSIDYSIMKNREDLSLKCQLIDNNGTVVDSYFIILKKRTKLAFDNTINKLSNEYNYSNNTRVKLIDKEIIFENISSFFDDSYITLKIPTPKNRKLSISGKIKLIKQKDNNAAFSGKIGFWNNNRLTGNIITSSQNTFNNDSTEYSFISHIDNSTLFFDNEKNEITYISIYAAATGQGPYKIVMKDITFQDITDIDKDGVLDFYDLCPDEPGHGKGCPDSIPPTIITKNISLSLNQQGIVLLTPNMVDNGTYDDIHLDSVSISKSVFTCNNIGVNSITFSAIDQNGNTSKSNVYVYINDTTPPIPKVKDIELLLYGTDSIKVSFNDIDNGTSDNCTSYSAILSKDYFTTKDDGKNEITTTIFDSYNNSTTIKSNIFVRSILSDQIYKKNKILLYPNPTSSTLNIELNDLTITTHPSINIYNTSGLLVKTISSLNTKNKDTISLNISDLPAGKYLLKIELSKEQVEVLSFIISK